MSVRGHCSADPGKGNDKGKVEGLVGFIRRNFLVPVPRAESFAALNDALAEQCRRRQAAELLSKVDGAVKSRFFMNSRLDYNCACLLYATDGLGPLFDRWSDFGDKRRRLMEQS